MAVSSCVTSCPHLVLCSAAAVVVAAAAVVRVVVVEVLLFDISF